MDGETLAEIQKWMCYGPAEAYRIPNKGRILEGWDADLTLVDLEHTRPVRNEETFTKVRWSPWHGRELYGWPTQAGGQPPLVEEYTYRDVRVNVGLTDADFDPENPNYNF